MIELINITKSYGNNVILKNLNLKVNNGELIQISGASGAGKTTLLRCIAGLDKFEEGSIKIDNQLVQSKKVFIPSNKRKIGMMFQDNALYPHMTVWQNVNFVSSSIISDKNERNKWNEEILHSFKVDHKKNNYPGEISGGEQQRVSLVRALANKPQILLLDEPFSHLDKSIIQEIIQELESFIQNKGISLISVTHNPFKFNTLLQQFKKLENKFLQ